MNPQLLKFRPAPFALALLCFTMPFVSLSCGGTTMSFSGFQVAFGTTVEGRSFQGESAALLAFLVAVGGLVAGVLATRTAGMAAVACGGVGTVLLLVLQAQIHGEPEIRGPIQISYGPGYWLAVLALAGGAGLSAWALNAERPQSSPEAAVAPPPGSGGGTDA
mgnify:CR=1 FL=1